MIVHAITNFELRAVDGRVLRYTPGKKIIFKDEVARRLISQGKVEPILNHPEASVNEYMDLWQAIFKALAKGKLSLKKFDGSVQIQVGQLSTSVWHDHQPSIADIFFTPTEIMDLLLKYFSMNQKSFGEYFRAICLTKEIFEGSHIVEQEVAKMSERLAGKIKFFSSGGRYGFIIGPDGREFYFRESDVHRSVTDLQGNDPVTFNVVNAMRGPRAVAVRKTSSPKGESDAAQ